MMRERKVMGATGGYERTLCALVWAAGVPVAIANPRSARRFAEAMSVPEKTDRPHPELVEGRCGPIAWQRLAAERREPERQIAQAMEKSPPWPDPDQIP